MITTLVIKAIRACNLRCPYCYYINEQTHGYGMMIAPDTVEAMYRSLARYAANGGCPELALIWHGGEPLMLGRRRFQSYLDLQRPYFADLTVRNLVQSNGVLIDEDWIEFFRENDIRVGISLDGTRAVHDRYRVTPKGEGTYDQVVQAIQLLQRHGRPAGVLGVANADDDATAFLLGCREMGIRAIDFLLPMTNHALQRLAREGQQHPAGHADGPSPVDMAAVGRNLQGAFRAWVERDDPSLRVRLFEALILNALGARQSCSNAGVTTETMGSVVVVETDGDICMDTDFSEIDRFALGKEYRLGYNLRDPAFSFADVERDLLRHIAEKRLAELPDDCQRCRARSVCRGSHPASRFDSADAGYNHRSAYCEAMFGLSLDILDYVSGNGFQECLVDPALRPGPPQIPIAVMEQSRLE